MANPINGLSPHSIAGAMNDIDWSSLDLPEQSPPTPDLAAKFPTPEPAPPQPAGASVGNETSRNQASTRGGHLDRTADEMLEAASSEAQQQKVLSTDYDRGPVGWLLCGINVFKDTGVLLHLFTLSIVLGSCVAFFIYRPYYALGVFPIALVFFTIVLNSGLTIVQSFANGDDQVEEWSTLDFWSWIESSLVIGASLICSLTLPLFFATLFPMPALARVSMMLAGGHFIFPFVLMSILESGSILAPVSIVVIKAWGRGWAAVSAFYLSAGPVLALAPLYFAITPFSPAFAAVGCGVSIAVAFMYFGLLGRLARSLTVMDNEDRYEGEDELRS